MVEATLNYLADMPERPFFYLYGPPADQPARNTKGDRRTVAIHDARDLAAPPSLDREGFVLVQHQTTVEDPANVRRAFYDVVNEAKLPHFSPHSTRHTFASFYLTESPNADVYYLSRMLGHASIQGRLRPVAPAEPQGRPRRARRRPDGYRTDPVCTQLATKGLER